MWHCTHTHTHTHIHMRARAWKPGFPHASDTVRHAESGVGGLSTSGSGGGGGVDTALRLAPPPPPQTTKRSIDWPPQTPTETDPPGPGGDPDLKIGKK